MIAPAGSGTLTNTGMGAAAGLAMTLLIKVAPFVHKAALNG